MMCFLNIAIIISFRSLGTTLYSISLKSWYLHLNLICLYFLNFLNYTVTLAPTLVITILVPLVTSSTLVVTLISFFLNFLRYDIIVTSTSFMASWYFYISTYNLNFIYLYLGTTCYSALRASSLVPSFLVRLSLF